MLGHQRTSSSGGVVWGAGGVVGGVAGGVSDSPAGGWVGPAGLRRCAGWRRRPAWGVGVGPPGGIDGGIDEGPVAVGGLTGGLADGRPAAYREPAGGTSDGHGEADPAGWRRCDAVPPLRRGEKMRAVSCRFVLKTPTVALASATVLLGHRRLGLPQ